MNVNIIYKDRLDIINVLQYFITGSLCFLVLPSLMKGRSNQDEYNSSAAPPVSANKQTNNSFKRSQTYCLRFFQMIRLNRCLDLNDSTIREIFKLSIKRLKMMRCQMCASVNEWMNEWVLVLTKYVKTELLSLLVLRSIWFFWPRPDKRTRSLGRRGRCSWTLLAGKLNLNISRLQSSRVESQSLCTSSPQPTTHSDHASYTGIFCILD